MIEYVDPKRIATEWEHIKPAFENFEAKSDGRWTVPYLVQMALTEQKQVWKVNDWQAIAVTSMNLSDRYMTLEACFGEDHLSWYEELEETLSGAAKAAGATRMFGMARPGWTKAFKKQGYREIHREFVKEI